MPLQFTTGWSVLPNRREILLPFQQLLLSTWNGYAAARPAVALCLVSSVSQECSGLSCGSASPVRTPAALAHQTRPSLTSSFGRALTKHFLAGSTSAQALLTLHRHSSVLMSFAHPRAQTPSKCCSGCSPSAHPCSVPFLVPYYDWIPGPCPYLSSLEFGQVYAMFYQGPIWGSPGPENMPSPKTGHSVSQ
jgi:hypothetical protein